MIAKTYDRQTAKFLAVVGENMPEISGDVMQGWIQNPKAVQKALEKAFCPSEKTSTKFEIWKSIKLGIGPKTADDFRQALRDGGFQLSNWALGSLEKACLFLTDEETEIDLVKITVAEFGFKKGARRDQIYKKAKELGLALCPLEIGPQLRLQYRDQPRGEWIFVAHAPIFDSNYVPGVFSVVRGGSELWLDGRWGNIDDYVWHPDCLWAFVRPRK